MNDIIIDPELSPEKLRRLQEAETERLRRLAKPLKTELKTVKFTGGGGPGDPKVATTTVVTK